jgi:hypothetical protein
MSRIPHCLDNRLTVNCEILATCSSTYSPVRTSQETLSLHKVKLSPLQAVEFYRFVRCRGSHTVGSEMAVKLSALRTGCPLLLRNIIFLFLILISVRISGDLIFRPKKKNHLLLVECQNKE